MSRRFFYEIHATWNVEKETNLRKTWSGFTQSTWTFSSTNWSDWWGGNNHRKSFSRSSCIHVYYSISVVIGTWILIGKLAFLSFQKFHNKKLFPLHVTNIRMISTARHCMILNFIMFILVSSSTKCHCLVHELCFIQGTHNSHCKLSRIVESLTDARHILTALLKWNF